MADELSKAIRAGRHRLQVVAVVRAACTCLLPVSCALVVVALGQRSGLVHVAWWPVSIAAVSVWAVGSIVLAAPWSVTDSAAALALDEGLDLDDRLGTAISSGPDDGPMAARARAQTRSFIAGKVTGRGLRAALPLTVPRTAGVSALAVALALILAGTPSSVARAQEIRQKAQVELAQAAELARPLASQDEALARALDQLQAPMPEFDTPEAVEMEALRRLTTLQGALEDLADSDAPLAAADAAEALRSMPESTTADAQVRAIRDALRTGDFDRAQDAMEEMARDTRETPPTDERAEALETLARDLDEAAQRAREEEQSRSDGASGDASKAIERMAQDMRQCSEGTCESPSGDCESLASGSETGEAARSAGEAAAAAAAACANQAGSPVSMGGGGAMPVAEDDATAQVQVRPDSEGDADATIVEIESVAGDAGDARPQGHRPMPVGEAPAQSSRGPTREALRRLPARYQDAVRRFFGSGSPSPDESSGDDGSVE